MRRRIGVGSAEEGSPTVLRRDTHKVLVSFAAVPPPDFTVGCGVLGKAR